jgi:hypothetical protein
MNLAPKRPMLIRPTAISRRAPCYWKGGCNARALDDARTLGHPEVRVLRGPCVPSADLTTHHAEPGAG